VSRRFWSFLPARYSSACRLQSFECQFFTQGKAPFLGFGADGASALHGLPHRLEEAAGKVFEWGFPFPAPAVAEKKPRRPAFDRLARLVPEIDIIKESFDRASHVREVIGSAQSDPVGGPRQELRPEPSCYQIAGCEK
jgi:hypothetical protein